jgi:hypothetical protein
MTKSYYVAAGKDDKGCVVGSGLGSPDRIRRIRRTELRE